jgi:hypothetical protein
MGPSDNKLIKAVGNKSTRPSKFIAKIGSLRKRSVKLGTFLADWMAFHPCACCANINRPAGVSFSFQVSEYSIEPFEGILARNLLANKDDRSADFCDPEQLGPEVSRVVEPFLEPGCREGLARARPAVDADGVLESAKDKCGRPATNAGKEVALVVGFEFFGLDFMDTAGVNDTIGDDFKVNEFAQPRCRV